MQCKIKQHSCFDEHIPYVNAKYIKCRPCENAEKNVKVYNWVFDLSLLNSGIEWKIAWCENVPEFIAKIVMS